MNPICLPVAHPIDHIAIAPDDSIYFTSGHYVGVYRDGLRPSKS